MLIEGIKSRPQYEPLQLDPTGARHLLVVDAADLPEEARGESWPPLASVETWFVMHESRAIPGRTADDEEAPRVRRFRSADHLGARLAHELAAARMGLRLYAVGGEAFLWTVFGIAQEAGMSRQEVRLVQSGSRKRRIFCVHCRSYTDGVATNIVPCAGCGAPLLVRDHFSRRLGAYMGVQADAEAPGDVPPIEEIYT